MALVNELQATHRDLIKAQTHHVANEIDGTDYSGETFANAAAHVHIDGRIALLARDWTLEDGTALAVFADGASATPGYHDGGGTEVAGIRWNNHATPTHILAQFIVPQDMDVSQAATLSVLAAKTGATLADAVTWEVTAFSVGDADLYDADADFGGTSSAMTGDAAAKTCQLETLSLAASSMTRSDVVTITIQPTDGTLGTDDVILMAVYIDYKKRTS